MTRNLFELIPRSQLDWLLAQTIHDIPVSLITCDSRQVIEDSIFCAIAGDKFDGHDYIDEVLARNPALVIAEHYPGNHPKVINIPDARQVWAFLSAAWFNFPANKLQILGVTGTNGKTTSALMTQHILGNTKTGFKPAYLGTLGRLFNGNLISGNLTTPDAYVLQQNFSELLNDGCTHVAMEVSSHALKQNRTYSIPFVAAAYTNLTQDHLDFHKSMEDYKESKAILFQKYLIDNQTQTSIINIDDPYGEYYTQQTTSRVLPYSLNNPTTNGLVATDLRLSIEGTDFCLKYADQSVMVTLALPGRFNVYNALAAAGLAIASGLSLEQVRSGLSTFTSVPGRVEKVSVNSEQNITVLVDYAHTPDALNNVLNMLRELREPSCRVITVFGCGGDRDPDKRPKMGAVVAKLADIPIITSDNPRTEDPMSIIDMIIPGVKIYTDRYLVEVDRKQAIRLAIKTAKVGDIVLIAGKGHEDYQILGNTRIHFDDREIAAETLREVFD